MSGAHAQGFEKCQQVQRPVCQCTGKALDQAGGQMAGINRWHEAGAGYSPQRGCGEELAPPLPPTGNGAWLHIQAVAQVHCVGAQRGASLGQYHHGQGEVNAPPQKSHRLGCCALAAQIAAKAKTRFKVAMNLLGASPGFAWVVGSVQTASARAGRCVHLGREFGINLNQQEKKLWGLK